MSVVHSIALSPQPSLLIVVGFSIHNRSCVDKVEVMSFIKRLESICQWNRRAIGHGANVTQQIEDVYLRYLKGRKMQR